MIRFKKKSVIGKYLMFTYGRRPNTTLGLYIMVFFSIILMPIFIPGLYLVVMVELSLNKPISGIAGKLIDDTLDEGLFNFCGVLLTILMFMLTLLGVIIGMGFLPEPIDVFTFQKLILGVVMAPLFISLLVRGIIMCVKKLFNSSENLDWD